MTNTMRQLTIVGLALFGSLVLLTSQASAETPPASPDAAKAAAPAPTKAPRHIFEDPGRAGTVQWMEQLEADLQSYLRATPAEEAKALKAMLAYAFDARSLESRLRAFKAATQKLNVKTIRLSSVDVRGTLWHHRIPVRDLDLSFFRAGDHGIQLSRLLTQKTYHTFFGGPAVLARTAPVDRALGSLADQVAKLAQNKHCDRLPTVRPVHFEPYLPKQQGARKQTLFHLHKARHRQKAHCLMAAKLPWTHLTFRASGVGGVLIDKSGARHGVRIRLMPREDGTRHVAILTMTDPIAAPPSSLKIKHRNGPKPLSVKP